MPDEARVNTDELRRLGDVFETHAYDLGRHLTAFRGRTDADALREGYGESEPLAQSSLAELSEAMGLVIGRLQNRLDEMGGAMKETARNIVDTEEETASMIRGI